MDRQEKSRKEWKNAVIAVLLILAAFFLSDRQQEKVRESGTVSEKRIALTFDDGPHETYTMQLLEGLKERGVKVTFFLIGENIERYPEVVKKEAEDGHLLGNHTYSHIQLKGCTEEQAVNEISRTNRLIYELTGKVPEYIRPPFGQCTARLQEKVPMDMVLWDVDPMDWKYRDKDYVVNHVCSHAGDGDVILLHDVYRTSAEAALEIIDRLQKEGYVFVTVDELYLD